VLAHRAAIGLAPRRACDDAAICRIPPRRRECYPLAVMLGRKLVALLAIAAALVSGAAGAGACDVCAIYTATEMHEARTGFRLGVGEQFSRFGTLQDDGEELDNPGEKIHSSITQVFLGYDVRPWIGFQFNLPIIVRDFRRLEDGVLEDGDESGIGDVSLIAIARPYSFVGEDSVVRFSLFGGLKFPTGDSDRLGEEAAEEDEGGEDDHHDEANGLGVGRFRERHAGHDHGEGETPSGVHGHDLALGSGSVDGVIGGAVFGSWRRFFMSASIQYAMRTEGDFDYRYANDLTWTGGPGVYYLLEHAYSLTLQFLVTGEYKNEDEQNGQSLDDTAITAVYLGPGVGFTWRSSLAVEIATDFPVLQDNSGVQLVPDYRIRGGFNWKF
jgi:hypothetical protein